MQVQASTVEKVIDYFHGFVFYEKKILSMGDQYN
jgi:hypothetical protein